MAKLKDIVDYLDGELDIRSFEDSSNNGLQVETKKPIKKIGFAVDGCLEVFEKAKEKACDLIIVHHGISWNDSLKRITNMNYDRLSYLIKNDIGLYGCHLPLDAHSKYGNNITIGKLLGLKKLKKFGDYHSIPIGYGGELEKRLTIDKFAKLVEDKLDTIIRIIGHGKDEIKRVAIVSGGGSSSLNEAIRNDYDVLIVGEAPHHTYHETKEGSINLVLAGHYNTEVFGVKALMPVLEKKFKVKTEFIDVPTGF